MFEYITKKILYILCSFVLCLVAFCSFFTFYLNEYTKDLSNYVWLYLLLFVFIVLLFYIFMKLVPKLTHLKLVYSIYFLFVLIIPILLVFFSSQTNLEYDCKDIFNFTFESLNGDYHQVFKGYYMSTYTWQYGLSLLQTLIIKISQIFIKTIIYDYSLCLKILFYVNGIMSSASLLFGFLTIKLLSNNNEKSKLAFVFLSITCIPFFLYTLYIYSDVPSICFLMIATYFFAMFIKKNKYLYCFISTLFLCFSCMIRLSSIVFAIAFMLVILYNSIIENKNLLKALLSLLFIVLPILSNKLPALHYEFVSNYKQIVNSSSQKISDGCPVSLNIAMGIDVDARMYGWYTGKNYDTCFNICDHDSACEIALANKSIDNSLKTLANSLPLSLDFFFKKLVSEWGDGTFEAFYSTKIVGDTVDRFVVNLLYKDSSNMFLHCFAKAHIIFICLLSACFVVIKRRCDKLSIFNYTLEILILGGFLLSIFWETGGRYNFPYVYILVMIASLNVGQTVIKDMINKILTFQPK